MKTPDDIKKGARHCISDYSSYHCGECPYRPEGGMCKSVLHTDLLSLIQQFESTVSQVSKALCGKENATLDELLQAVDQLKSRLAQVEWERDSMMPVFIREMKKYGCSTCEHYIPAAYTQECLGCGNAKLLHWKWNGIWPENTKEDET